MNIKEISVNIQDIIDTLKEEAQNDQVADLANASIEVVLATAKLIGLYKDYYSKGAKKFRFNGESHTLGEWADITGISEKTLRKRITTNHWDISDALNTPVGQSPNQKAMVTVLQYNYKRQLIREFKSINEAARQRSRLRSMDSTYRRRRFQHGEKLWKPHNLWQKQAILPHFL